MKFFRLDVKNFILNSLIGTFEASAVFASVVFAMTVLASAIFVSVMFIPSAASASTKVAFLESYDRNGNLIQYAPGGRFGHSAMQIGNLWLQAYPHEGVKLITWQELNHRGKVAAILEIPVDIRPEQFQKYIGKPFDFDYSWTDDAFYCSELLGKILNIPTEPMHFNHAVWPKWYWDKENTQGLSPDGAYKYLKAKYNL